MSRLVDDVKTTLKGVKGAGDAIRGDLLDATDKAFEKDPNDPTSIATNTKNQAIREKGKQDVRKADEMFARREWERKRGAEPGVGTPANTERVPEDTSLDEAAGRVPAAENAPVASRHEAHRCQAPALETATGHAPAGEQHVADRLDETRRL